MKYAFLGAMIFALSACASTPKDMSAANTDQQIIPPVVTRPAPITPVVRAPVRELSAVPLGPLPGTVDDFKYTSGEDRIYFAYNQYDLVPVARDVLRRQAQWLNMYPSAILIVGGNADERGTREYNLALGARRADAVKAFLVSQGVAPGRITTVSYGKERPIDGGSNEAAWALNRNAHSSVLIGGNS
ncbi:MAG: peptidoglycan-associated lipoprotein [Robiginitomaculum sp.]|nr:MAG: peptidoglycan-associated lipoprotein [Robiginitomaculum sp.]